VRGAEVCRGMFEFVSLLRLRCLGSGRCDGLESVVDLPGIRGLFSIFEGVGLLVVVGGGVSVCLGVWEILWVRLSGSRLTVRGVGDALVGSSVLVINCLDTSSVAYFLLFFDSVGCGSLIGGIMVGFVVFVEL